MKKLLSYIIALSIILTSLMSGFAYSDILESHNWAEEAIDYLNKKNILNGYDDGSFKPNGNVTRAELAKILVCAYDLKEKSISAVLYADVFISDWYYTYASAASGLFKTTDKKFHPERYATREEVAYAIYMASGEFNTKIPLKFSDTSEINNDYYDAVSCLSYNEIIMGYDNNTFKPQNNVSRIEATAMIYRALTQKPIPEPEPVTPEVSPVPTKKPTESPTPSPSPNVKANNYFCLVTRVSVVIEDGEAVTKITVYNEGKEEDVIIGEKCRITPLMGTTDSDIKRNDIVSYTRDYFGEVRNLQILNRLGSSSAGISLETMPTYKLYDIYLTTFGEAVKLYKNTAIELKVKSGDNKLYGISRDVNVYIYKSGKLELSDLGRLEDTSYKKKGDYVLALLDDDELKEILIIKE